MSNSELQHPLPSVPDWAQPDSVLGPALGYGEEGFFLDYPASDERSWIRTVFERLDALRVSRGEYAPYQVAPSDRAWFPLTVVRPSSWLAARHAYETRHYGQNYSWGADVDEMLEEFEHYVFTFHDEFVEVIAGGVHFEQWTERPQANTLQVRTGWAPLPESPTSETWEIEGIMLSVRQSALDAATLIEKSVLCDQVAVEIAPVLDGQPRVTRRLTVRTRDGRVWSRWRNNFGRVEAVFKGVPQLEDLRPQIAAHAAEIRNRRDAMGLT